MKLDLYNTLTAKKEEFKSIDQAGKKVGLYTCGPTVYNYAHIGNLRAYVFADTLRRALEYTGYEVNHVINITDIGQLTSDADDGEDKMVKALKREGKPHTLEAMKEVALKYETAFFNDLKKLNIEMPSVAPRASEHIAEDIELIQKLEAKGVAYKTSDGIYFDISKFPAYGTHGGFKLGELQEGARVAVNTEKKNPRDFALWKFSTGEIGFPAPFGRGFPGWHIECSGMSRKYLGQPFDIHTGGIDHIPVHHQNEIAQSEMAYGVPLANVWMHSEFLNMGTEKMAKSVDNFITLQTLIDRGIHPLAYRYYLLQAHYRSPIAFSERQVHEVHVNTLVPLYLAVSGLPLDGTIDAEYQKRFLAMIQDNLNTAEALSLVYAILGDVGHLSPENKRATIVDFDRVLGLDIENQSRRLVGEMNAIPDDIKKLSAVREDARRQKDYQKSDELRDEIAKEGFEVMDTDSGPVVRKKI